MRRAFSLLAGRKPLVGRPSTRAVNLGLTVRLGAEAAPGSQRNVARSAALFAFWLRRHLWQYLSSVGLKRRHAEVAYLPQNGLKEASLRSTRQP